MDAINNDGLAEGRRPFQPLYDLAIADERDVGMQTAATFKDCGIVGPQTVLSL